MEDGMIAFPSVRDITADENLTERGTSLDMALATAVECFTNIGDIALMPKQNAPANGFSSDPPCCALMPFTLLPTLA
jgi:hypothetical protein